MFGTSYPILGGNLSAEVCFRNKKVAKKFAKGKITEAKKILCRQGKYSLVMTDNWGQKIESDMVPSFLQNIEEIKELSEDKAVHLQSAAGWGLFGGIATGGIGMLAAALLAGRGRNVTFGIRFKDGSHFICNCQARDYAKLLADSSRF